MKTEYIIPFLFIKELEMNAKEKHSSKCFQNSKNICENVPPFQRAKWSNVTDESVLIRYKANYHIEATPIRSKDQEPLVTDHRSQEPNHTKWTINHVFSIWHQPILTSPSRTGLGVLELGNPPQQNLENQTWQAQLVCRISS